MGITVRMGNQNDLGSVANVLSAAFQDDPVMQWLWPDASDRVPRLTRLYKTIVLRQHFPAQTVDVAQDEAGNIGGVALWARPDKWKTPRTTQLAMMPGLVRAYGSWAGLQRGAQLEASTEQSHPLTPHWYLATIGTDSEVRGSGFAHALIRSRLNTCDQEKSAVYLESSNPANLPYYRRFGFEVSAEISIPDGGPVLWGMWRPPK
ncbi:UNVERIFIED_ORG: ribosomal protein S18 acetylase RimI-like enzyme [Rhodococcus erythropolis]